MSYNYYRWKLEHNESEQEVWSKGYQQEGTLQLNAFDGFECVVNYFRDHVEINEVSDWECNEDETKGTIWCCNSLDGLGLQFSVVLV